MGVFKTIRVIALTCRPVFNGLLAGMIREESILSLPIRTHELQFWIVVNNQS